MGQQDMRFYGIWHSYSCYSHYWGHLSTLWTLTSQQILYVFLPSTITPQHYCCHQLFWWLQYPCTVHWTPHPFKSLTISLLRIIFSTPPQSFLAFLKICHYWNLCHFQKSQLPASHSLSHCIFTFHLFFTSIRLHPFHFSKSTNHLLLIKTDSIVPHYLTQKSRYSRKMRVIELWRKSILFQALK